MFQRNAKGCEVIYRLFTVSSNKKWFAISHSRRVFSSFFLCLYKSFASALRNNCSRNSKKYRKSTSNGVSYKCFPGNASKLLEWLLCRTYLRSYFCLDICCHLVILKVSLDMRPGILNI